MRGSPNLPQPVAVESRFLAHAKKPAEEVVYVEMDEMSLGDEGEQDLTELGSMLAHLYVELPKKGQVLHKGGCCLAVSEQ